METEQEGGKQFKPEWSTGLWWWGLTTVGWAAAGTVLLINVILEAILRFAADVAPTLMGSMAAELVPSLVLGLLVGLISGLLQWIILRRRMPRAGWWIPVSAFGFALAWAVADMMRPVVSRLGVVMLEEMLRWLMGGAVFGFLQWLVLRRHIPRSGWWVLANAIGLAAGWPLATIVANALTSQSDIWALIFLSAVGAVVGVLEGAVLAWSLGGKE